MHKGRMFLILRHIDNIPEDQFDITDWQCGTVKCVIGHACDIKAFNDVGFRMCDEGGGAIYPVFTEEGLEYHGMLAVSKFLQISYEDAMFLFSDKDYHDNPSLADVKERIQEYYEKHSGHKLKDTPELTEPANDTA